MLTLCASAVEQTCQSSPAYCHVELQTLHLRICYALSPIITVFFLQKMQRKKKGGIFFRQWTISFSLTLCLINWLHEAWVQFKKNQVTYLHTNIININFPSSKKTSYLIKLCSFESVSWRLYIYIVCNVLTNNVPLLGVGR